jgi:pilus assembly protein CpaF
LTTIHANSTRDALMRLETMVAMANLDIPSQFLRRYISSAINVIVQVSRMVDGKRRLVGLQEIVGMEGDIITMQEIFSFKQAGVDPDGNVRGRFAFSGVRPKFSERLISSGIDVPQEIFDPSNVLEI